MPLSPYKPISSLAISSVDEMASEDSQTMEVGGSTYPQAKVAPAPTEVYNAMVCTRCSMPHILLCAAIKSWQLVVSCKILHIIVSVPV